MKNKIASMLDDCIYEIFLECQNELEITFGDVEPIDEIKLNRLINELAEHVSNILEKQKEV